MDRYSRASKIINIYIEGELKKGLKITEVPPPELEPYISRDEYRTEIADPINLIGLKYVTKSDCKAILIFFVIFLVCLAGFGICMAVLDSPIGPIIFFALAFLDFVFFIFHRCFSDCGIKRADKELESRVKDIANLYAPRGILITFVPAEGEDEPPEKVTRKVLKVTILQSSTSFSSTEPSSPYPPPSFSSSSSSLSSNPSSIIYVDEYSQQDSNPVSDEVSLLPSEISSLPPPPSY